MTRFEKFATTLLAVLALSGLAAGPGATQISPNTDRPLYPGGEVNANPADLGAVVPRDDVIEAMVKNALMTLNDANLTGNYDVFHARLHALFRQQKTAAELAAIFAGFRSVKVDLAPALVHRPIFVEPPRLDGDEKLRAKGFFETRPWRVNFDLDWGRDGNKWALLRINVQARPPDQ
jgi:hypothetical protein